MNIENKKQFAIILLAAGLGLIAAFLASQYIKDDVNRQTKALAEEYAKQNAGLVQEIEYLKNDMKQLAAQQQTLAQQQAQGGAAAQQPGGAPVAMTAFSVKTPFGKRALTISIDSLSAVGGLINPGDFVDLIAHLDIPEQQDGATKNVTTVLFQNIQVLAIGTNFEAGVTASQYQSQQGAGALYVTLAVSPEESGLLTFAQSHGKLQMALRAPSEQEKPALDVASWDSLSDFIKKQQGTDLLVPKAQKKIEMMDNGNKKSGDEIKPFIQIFRGGKEL